MARLSSQNVSALDEKGVDEPTNSWFRVAPTRSMTRTWLAKRRPDVAPTDFSLEDLKVMEEELRLRE
eukprot:symbB.v1.2.042190.t1/scaffold9433.1/size3289/1